MKVVRQRQRDDNIPLYANTQLHLEMSYQLYYVPCMMNLPIYMVYTRVLRVCTFLAAAREADRYYIGTSSEYVSTYLKCENSRFLYVIHMYRDLYEFACFLFSVIPII